MGVGLKVDVCRGLANKLMNILHTSLARADLGEQCAPTNPWDGNLGKHCLNINPRDWKLGKRCSSLLFHA